jgi:hypothetical protein
MTEHPNSEDTPSTLYYNTYNVGKPLSSIIRSSVRYQATWLITAEYSNKDIEKKEVRL